MKIPAEKTRLQEIKETGRAWRFWGPYRGPVWFPTNYMILRALLHFYLYYGDDFKVECPTGSGQYMTLIEIGSELARRLCGIFLRNESGNRPVFGGQKLFDHDPYWRDLIPFHEYFHGDNGAGIGASHQTGWTGLVASLIRLRGANDLKEVSRASTEVEAELASP
jgi:hypothetical protein